MLSIGFGMTDVGLKRSNNEDSICVDNDLGVYIVCDGMGGHANGEVASQMAVDTCIRLLEKNQDKIDKLSDSTTPDSEIIRFVESLVQTISQKIHKKSTSDNEYYKMGTTFTLLLILKDRAVMGHVGDSRLYILRDGQVSKLSDDHTMVNEMLRYGMIKEEEATTHPFANQIIRCMGLHDFVQVDTLLFDLLPEDQFLLCSDGVSRYIDSYEDILEIFERNELKDVPRHFVEFSKNKGGDDNISAVAIEISASKNSDDEKHRKVQKIVDSFQEATLFSDFSLRNIFKMSQVCEIGHLKKNEVLRYEKIYDSYYIILEGQVTLQQNKNKVTIGHGDSFGVESLIDLEVSYTAEASTDVEYLRIDSESFKAVIRRNPRLGLKFYQSLSKHIASLSQNFVVI